MHIDARTFIVHDVTGFPLVVFNAEAATIGYASQWEKEMAFLMDHDRPFVVVYDHYRGEESHEDRKRRGMWLKHHKAALGRVCRAIISIESDEGLRVEAQARSEMAVKAYGIPHEVVATRDDALIAAHRITAMAQ